MFLKKSLGQNLLIDKNIVKKILSLTNIKDKNVIEIGPGTGNLTYEILKLKPKNLICVEKDKKLSEKLKLNLVNTNNNIKIKNADILSLDLTSLIKRDTVVLGNLPYNISTQILIKFLKLNPWSTKLSKIIFMFQKEVGEKIIAKFGNKNYSRLSIITRSRLKVEDYFYVSKNSFYPKPKIDSIVISFDPIFKKDLNLKSLDSLEYITRVIFSNKRKMINKNFRKLKINHNKFIKNNKIDLKLRPEQINEKTYYKIAEYFEKTK